MYANIFYIINFILILTTCNAYRLPGNLKPNLYHLEIKTFLENDFWFEGLVKIRFECLNATSLVVLNSNGLKIAEKDVTVTQVNGDQPIEVTGHQYQPENEFYIISLGKLLEQGRVYTVTIPYIGQLSTDMVGYYRSSYMEKKTGQTK